MSMYIIAVSHPPTVEGSWDARAIVLVSTCPNSLSVQLLYLQIIIRKMLVTVLTASRMLMICTMDHEAVESGK